MVHVNEIILTTYFKLKTQLHIFISHTTKVAFMAIVPVLFSSQRLIWVSLKDGQTTNKIYVFRAY